MRITVAEKRAYKARFLARLSRIQSSYRRREPIDLGELFAGCLGLVRSIEAFSDGFYNEAYVSFDVVERIDERQKIGRGNARSPRRKKARKARNTKVQRRK